MVSTGAGIWLFILGILIGGFGTLIGAGGGFILIPVMLIIYPSDEPEVLTAISLAVIVANAAAGSVAYARKRRIDYRSAFTFAAAAAPGSIIGVYLNRIVPRRSFDPVFGAVLVLLALYLLTRRNMGLSEKAAGRPDTLRTLTDSDGKTHEYRYDNRLALAISAAVGVISSFLGIGGGVIHVPAMVHLLNFPVHLATATSHLVLGLTAALATLQHAINGSLTEGLPRLIYLTPGVILGAPLGARLSQKLKAPLILRLLAGALLLIGLRLILQSL